MTTYTSIANVIKERRSVRTFTDKAVEKDLLIELLNDATWAPNHKHREPWNCKLYIGEAQEISRCGIKLFHGRRKSETR